MIFEKRQFLLIALIFSICFSTVFFGAVYEWTAFFLCSLLFSLVLISPGILHEVKNLPRLFVIGISLVIVWIIFQSKLSSVNHYETFLESMKWLAMACAFLAVQSFSRDSLQNVSYSLVILGIIISVYGCYQVWFGNDSVLWEEKSLHIGYVTGTFKNRNYMAGFLEMCLGVHLGLWLQSFWERRFKSILVLGGLLIIPAIAFARAGSRIGFTSFAISLVLYLVLLQFKKKRETGAYVTTLLVLFGSSVFVARDILISRFDDFQRHFLTLDGRSIAWVDSLHMLRDYLFQGVGLGNYEWGFFGLPVGNFGVWLVSRA